MTCKKCSEPMIGVEYALGSSNHYDGVSEWKCLKCDIRIGRWSGKKLTKSETEAPYNNKA